MNIEIARKGLESTNADVVVASLKVLSVDGKLTDLQAILALLKHPSQLVKTTAINVACDLIRNNLIEHFNELDATVRTKLGALMESLDPLIIDEIAHELYSEDDKKRVRAIQLLGLLRKNPKIRDIMTKLVQDKNERIRATAINLLGKIMSADDHELILSLLNDKDKRVRANTIEALESAGNKRIVPVLMRFHRDPVNRIRGNVLKALYNLGHTAIDDDLNDMLTHQDVLMQASALWVIAQIKLQKKEFEDSAGHLMLSKSEMVVINAVKALQAINTARALGYIKYLS